MSIGPLYKNLNNIRTKLKKYKTVINTFNNKKIKQYSKYLEKQINSIFIMIIVSILGLASYQIYQQQKQK